MNELIAIVDDEPDILELVALHLRRTGFRVQGYFVAKSFLRFLEKQHLILDDLWGHEKAVLDRTVDVHIRNLREKLGDAGGLIKNIRGVGYKLEP